VHLYGGACDLRRLVSSCKRHGLFLVEDCAEAIGTRIDGNHVGTFGNVGVFSFFGNKTITTGEGGMVVCSDLELDSKLRHFRGQGLAADREYWHDVVGYNYRMTNICAAIGLAQLERIEEILAAKCRLAALYREALSGTPLVFQASSPNEISSHWMITVLTPTAEDRDPLRAALASSGVETRPVFYPIHTMPMYATQVSYPVAEDIASRGINLPSWQNLPEAELRSIADVILDFEWPGR
jgi:perosamine synthetase